MNLYSEWRRNRMNEPGVDMSIVEADLDMLNNFNKGDLAYALSRFVHEVTTLDGSEYPPNTIREIVVMIQMFLHENAINWKLLEGDEFMGLRNVVDNTMKERHAMGVGVRHSSEIISLGHEDLLFGSGTLGEGNPTQLVQTLIYVIGMHCALRGGIEHINLRRPGCKPQIQIVKDTRGVECMLYTEDPLQKTNQGGLVCKTKPKTVNVYKASDVRRCPIHLFKKYIGLLPQSTSCSKLYLRPRRRYTPSVWFCDQPYGINKIKGTVKEVCKKAGLVGKFTNHSLRAMCASRMYAKEIPEQIIKEVTGHRSECVRTYKRTSELLKQKASRTVSNVDEPSTSSGRICEKKVVKVVKSNAEPVKIETEGLLSIAQMIENVNKTKAEMSRVKASKARSRLSLKKLRKNSNVTIDLNLKIV